METEQKKFVEVLIHAKASADEFDTRSMERDRDLDEVRKQLDGKVDVPLRDKDGKVVVDANGKPKTESLAMREYLRRDMQFSVVDRKGKEKAASFNKDGQEYAIDTEQARTKGHQMKKADRERVTEAAAMAFGLLETMRAKKRVGADGKLVLGKDGQPLPLYTNAELMEEFYTPMVREGLMPENAVINKFSATDELLKNTFDRYKDTLKDIEKAKEEKRNQSAVDRGGANGVLKRGKALAGKALEIKEDLELQLAEKIGESNLRRIKLAHEIGSSIHDFISENQDDLADLLGPGIEKIEDLIPEEAREWIASASQTLENPVTQALADPKAAFEDMKDKVIGEQTRRLMELYDRVADHAGKIKDEAKRTQFLQSAGAKIGKVADHMKDIGDKVPGADRVADFFAAHKESFTAAFQEAVESLADDAPEIGEQGQEIRDLVKEETKANQLAQIAKTVHAAARDIDQALTAAVKTVSPEAGVAIAGVYLAKINIKEVAADAVATPPEGLKVVEKLAAGLSAAISAVAPEDAPVFETIGGKVAARFRAGVDGNRLSKELTTKPGSAFHAVVDAALTAVEELDAAKSGSPTDAAEFTAIAQDKEKAKEMLRKSAVGDEEAALAEVEKSNEELREYQDQLIWLDAGGAAAKDSASIEKMISDLKKEKKLLELVASLGTALVSAGSAGASAGFKAANIATSAAAPTIVTGTLSAAKMIIKLAVNTKKAADRWVLWYKFRDSLSKAKTASSALTSTIQGFFNNKKEQIAFHTIEDALLAVQIAASIIGAVPEPITSAVGQSMALTAQAASLANDIAGKVYNEVMLSRAWSTTVAAMNSPADRALGLKALRLNPTLAMHALAWAGIQRQPPDPIARMVLSKLGISEKTIAAGADEGKVRDYLTELLDEDRTVLTTGVLTVEWLPRKYDRLSATDFFKIASRAAKEATPKLAMSGSERAVVSMLAPLATHNLKDLETRTPLGTVEPREIHARLEEARAAKETLRNYAPLSTGGNEQEDMANVRAEFLKHVADHLEKLEQLSASNAIYRQEENETRDKLAERRDALDALDGVTDKTQLQQGLTSGKALLKELKKKPWLATIPDLRSLMREITVSLLDIKTELDKAAP